MEVRKRSISPGRTEVRPCAVRCRTRRLHRPDAIHSLAGDADFDPGSPLKSRLKARICPAVSRLPLRRWCDWAVTRFSRKAKETEQMSKVTPLQFIQQVRIEIGKVVWPTRREVMLTTVMVFIMAALAATFFSLVDLGIRTGLSFLVTAFGA